ncbi:MAG: hypothetical protein MUF72_09970 [Elainella sp. Prado103]|jgi:hypothetical protein|nr:hypothetical protein [Elainella sp. Prado103]
MGISVVRLWVGIVGSGLAVAGGISSVAWHSLTSLTAPADLSLPLTTESPNEQPSQTNSQNFSEKQAEAPDLSPRTEAATHYLLDLSQGLQTAERDRLNSTQKLAIAQNILSWLREGEDYWGVRSRFDAAYSSQVAGDYGHNREVYIRFTTERFAPDHRATLKQPRQEPPIQIGAAPEVPIEPAETFQSAENYELVDSDPPSRNPYIRTGVYPEMRSGYPFYPQPGYRPRRAYSRRAF